MKKIRILKSSGIVLSKGREMRDILIQAVSQIPAVSKIHFNLFDGFAHRRDAKHVLEDHDFH